MTLKLQKMILKRGRAQAALFVVVDAGVLKKFGVLTIW